MHDDADPNSDPPPALPPALPAAPISAAERERFDELLEEAIAALPEHIAVLLEEVPVIVDDKPDDALASSLVREWGEDDSEDNKQRLIAELCGLHTGVMLTERSVEHPPDVPEDIRLFRVGIYHQAGGRGTDDDTLFEEIWVTLVHEIGHHFGLDEDDLDALGYA